MSILIYERALKLDPDTGETTSYWPEYWPIHLLACELVSMGSAYFAAAYQNDPTALEGNALRSAWVSFYLPQELILARQAAGVPHGTVHAGVDPTLGGTGVDPDDCAMVAGEVVSNQAFLIDCFAGRFPIEVQAQTIESWLDLWNPAFTIVEDTQSKGYVYTALSTQINDNKGTKHPFRIEKPQGGNAQGSKLTRFLSIGARFENAQVRVPGVLLSDGSVGPHPRFEKWWEQWKAFPSGHDDTLDATYWCVFSMFAIEAGIGVAMGPDRRMTDTTTQTAVDDAVQIIDEPVDSRGRPMVPIGTPFARPRRSFSIWRD